MQTRVEAVEVDDYDKLTAGAGLVVACDGLRSKVRDKHVDAFKPTLDVRRNRYIWLGTKKKFDAFTFYFEENAHGMFQVHAYRFDADTSTFIVDQLLQLLSQLGLMPLSSQHQQTHHRLAGFTFGFLCCQALPGLAVHRTGKRCITQHPAGEGAGFALQGTH